MPNWLTAVGSLIEALAPLDMIDWHAFGRETAGVALWDDPCHARGTPIAMNCNQSSYLKAFATVHWAEGSMHLSVNDNKTGAGDDLQYLIIPPNWLTAMKKIPGPNLWAGLLCSYCL
ncbi:MAG: hypothetical protein H7338_17885 [Candidatus Sericytochromatia bacterium]|nr:hypothetical protein [Candidatus Sericytochromatia bacterium]